MDVILDRYRELEQVGAGGFADVILAFDERVHRRVAIKQLPLTIVAGHAVGLDEARTAALLAHPNIVSLYDFQVDESRNTAYLIMEYVDGITLADIPSELLSDAMIAAVARALGDALSYAHKNGVLHLDVKPANVLIDHEGRIKLTDFGLARLSAHTGGASGTKKRGGVRPDAAFGTATAGTPGYMPLEQLAADAVDEATDQWAYAALIYELLADEYPYWTESGRTGRVDDLLAAAEHAEPALLDVRSPELNAALQRALSRNPDARCDSVAQLRDSLLEGLGGKDAVTAGRKELKVLVAELTDDEDPTRTAGRTPPNEEADARDRRGCAGTIIGVALKTLGGLALAVCLSSVLAPQLFGDKGQLIAAVAAGVFIIICGIGAASALYRRRRMR
ncbi:MAG: serine/threonine protein kinase [Actinomycetes bacterium]|nr:serine/threonine protein kinase [Actinomycetes bacterium]